MTNKSNLWKTVYLGLGYQKEKSPSWCGGEQGENGRHCCRGRKLRGHALNQKHKTERVKWIWLKAYSQWHTSFSKAVPSKPLPNVTTKRRVSIQILEPMGDIYHSNHYTITKKKKFFHVPSGIYHIIKTCSKQSMWIHTKNSCFHGYWNTATSSQLEVVLG